MVPTPCKPGLQREGAALGDVALLTIFVLLVTGLLLALEIGMRRAHLRH
jgi:hypothetical protein